jgi:ubiquinol oxidase
VAENPAREQVPFESARGGEDYGRFACLADLFRQIGYDERVHKLESLARLGLPRFQERWASSNSLVLTCSR